MMNTTTITPDISAGNPFSTTEGAYIGGAIKFTEGSLTGQYGKITAYTAAARVHLPDVATRRPSHSVAAHPLGTMCSL